MSAVSRNLLSPAIAVVMSKELRDAIHFGKRRIVRMQGQLHPSFLGNRQDCFEEVCVIGPNLFGRVFALELLLLNFLSKVIRPELPREIAAPLDLIRRVGIRRMEIVRGNRDVNFPDREEGPMGLDVLVATWLTELTFSERMRNGRPKDTNSIAGKSLLRGAQGLERRWLRPNSRRAQRIPICFKRANRHL
jgi:hypothetical protein